MKQCPACKTTYTDHTLKFCLADGNGLIELPDDEPTVVRGREPVRVEIPSASVSPQSAPAVHSTPRGMPGWLKVALALIIVGLAALAVAGLAGAAFYFSMGNANPTPTPAPPPSPRPTATRTPDLEKEKLRDEIANIQRQLDKRNKNAPDDDIDQRGSSVTATVDSPNDGFLALRDRPDAELGERIAKIPHGAEVEIMNCEKNTVAISGRTGRWCQVEYNGVNGWVFDAWLEY